MKILAAGATHPGKVRTENEDAYVASPSISVVCDGMGGEPDGDVAARLACATVEAAWRSDPWDYPLSRIKGAVDAANRAIVDSKVGHPAMATTCVAIAVEHGRAAVAWVGDSRAGLLRDGAFRWLTLDHSLQGDEVRLARAQGRAPREVRGMRNVVTRALGRAGTDVDVAEVDARPGDVFLLCTDGVHAELEDAFGSFEAGAVAPALGRDADPREVAEAVVGLAVEFGGSDNATAVVVRVDG